MLEKDFGLILQDPLSDITRRERRNLLGTSVVTWLITITEGYPSEFTTLGLVFDSYDKFYFAITSAVIVTYFFFAFIINAMADYMLLRQRQYEYNLKSFREDESSSDEGSVYDAMISNAIDNVDWIQHRVELILKTRTFFEFVLPIVVGIIAIYMTLNAAYCN